MSAASDKEIARKGRTVGLVIAGAGLAALLAPWIVARLGLSVRFEMLIYFGSLAAFVWAFVNIYQIWQLRQKNQG